MDDRAVAAYLERIGVARPEVADAAALRRLHLAHQRTIPFENLSIHLGEPISLAGDDLFAKIVTRRRGGFCYQEGRSAQDFRQVVKRRALGMSR